MRLTPIEAKAVRLVEENRVKVLWQGDGAAHGTVKGDHGIYDCSFSPEGRVCSCPSTKACSHSLALELHCEALVTGLM